MNNLLFITFSLFFAWCFAQNQNFTSPCFATTVLCSYLNGTCPDANLNRLDFNFNSNGTIANGTLNNFNSSSSFSLTLFNVISFSNLYIPTGSVQGRVAVKEDLTAATQFTVSIGDLVSFGINDVPYSLVVGRDVYFRSGRINPADELAFVGRNFNGSQSLQSRVNRTCSGSEGCLNQSFNNARNYWNQYSARIANLSVNTQYSMNAGNLSLICNSSSQNYSVVSINSAVFNMITSFSIQNCSPTTIWIFNINASSFVYFGALPFPSRRESLYNIIGSNIPVTASAFIYGTIINPNGSVNQTSGAISGGVIAGNIYQLLAVYPSNCPNTTGSSLTTSQFLTTSQITTSQSATTSSITTSQSSTTSSPSGTLNNLRELSNTTVDGNTTNCICPTITTSSVSSGFFTSGSITTSSITTGINLPSQNQDCPLLDWETSCPPLTIGSNNLTLSDYQVISFDGITANVGNIHGRIAAAGIVTLGRGFSVGDQLTYDDGSTNFTVVAGQFSMELGAVLPGTGLLYVGGNYSVPAYVNTRILGQQCGNNSNCIANAFNSSYNCYNSTQQQLASFTSNVQYMIRFSELSIVCNSPVSNRYYLTIFAYQLNTITYYTLENCNSQAEWIINVDGEGEVFFNGDGFPALPNLVLYNVLGRNRTIYVRSALNGAILSPNNRLDQSIGIIRGRVVVGSIIAILEVDKFTCINNNSTNSMTTASISSSTTSSISTSASITSGSNVRRQDPDSGMNSSSNLTVPRMLLIVITLFFARMH